MITGIRLFEAVGGASRRKGAGTTVRIAWRTLSLHSSCPPRLLQRRADCHVSTAGAQLAIQRQSNQEDASNEDLSSKQA
jgi:hypothetical protein